MKDYFRKQSIYLNLVLVSYLSRVLGIFLFCIEKLIKMWYFKRALHFQKASLSVFFQGGSKILKSPSKVEYFCLKFLLINRFFILVFNLSNASML